MFMLPTPEENPFGLHGRYYVEKVNGNTDPRSEFFVLRLDCYGKPDFIMACRKAIQTFADEIESTMPILAADIRARYQVPGDINVKCSSCKWSGKIIQCPVATEYDMYEGPTSVEVCPECMEKVLYEG